MRCLIATLGADAPGVNSTVRAVTRIALRRKLDVSGAKRGWFGLLRKEFWKLKESDVAAILSRGGSVLGSTDAKIRSDDRESHDRIAESLKKFDLVVATGGLGSFAVLNRIYSTHDMGLTTTMFVPASVEGEFLNPRHGVNDEVDDIHAESIGADTAGNRAVSAIDWLRDQAFHSHTVFLVECVGSKSNYLPLHVGTACGAQRIYLPLHPRLTEEEKTEIKKLYGSDFDPNYVDVEELVTWIERTFEETRRNYLLVILPSGTPLLKLRYDHRESAGLDYEQMITSLKPLELTVLRVAEALDIHFSRDPGAVQVRHVLVDDLQRGGSPSLKDRMLGTLYGQAAVEEFFSVINAIGKNPHRGNLNLLAIESSNRVGWKCHPREEVTHLFQGENPRGGGLAPLPFVRQARGLVAGFRAFSEM